MDFIYMSTVMGGAMSMVGHGLSLVIFAMAKPDAFCSTGV
jgi:hypothetical protein